MLNSVYNMFVIKSLFTAKNLFTLSKNIYLSFTSIYIDLFFLVYVDMGTGASDTVNLNLDFTDATNLANQRFFEIKVTQLPCSSEYG